MRWGSPWFDVLRFDAHLQPDVHESSSTLAPPATPVVGASCARLLLRGDPAAGYAQLRAAAREMLLPPTRQRTPHSFQRVLPDARSFMNPLSSLRRIDFPMSAVTSWPEGECNR